LPSALADGQRLNQSSALAEHIILAKAIFSFNSYPFAKANGNDKSFLNVK
jgi:hypothetical protein